MNMDGDLQGISAGSAAARAASALFSVPPALFPAMCVRYPAGTLWRAILPGTDPTLAMSIMGEGAGLALRAAATALHGGGGPSLFPGGLLVPLGAWPDPGTLSDALLADALACTRFDGILPMDDGISPGGTVWEGSIPTWIPYLHGGTEIFLDPLAWRVEIRHRSREIWIADVTACFDYAATVAAEGFPDTLDALVFCPSVDMRGILPIADLGARLRFAEALDRVGEDAEHANRFIGSYFRRSCIGVVVEAVGAALAALPGGHTGYHDDGWPAWWRGTAHEATAFSGIPSGLAQLSSAVSIGIPSGWSP